jgi:putative nucleotidyltransferase with HDIG domain
VTDLAVAIAQRLDLSDDQVEGIRVAATLHDIGKMPTPAEILSKPGRLSEQEFMFIQEHPTVAHAILKGIAFPWPVADIVLQHHERLDGSGYPAGLKGGGIPLEARIIAVADTLEAMSSHRPYRPALGVDEALREIREKGGRSTTRTSQRHVSSSSKRVSSRSTRCSARPNRYVTAGERVLRSVPERRGVVPRSRSTRRFSTY